MLLCFLSLTYLCLRSEYCDKGKNTSLWWNDARFRLLDLQAVYYFHCTKLMPWIFTAENYISALVSNKEPLKTRVKKALI